MNIIPVECFSGNLVSFLNRFTSVLSRPQKKPALKIIQGIFKNNDASLRVLSNGCIDKRYVHPFDFHLLKQTEFDDWNSIYNLKTKNIQSYLNIKG